VPYYGPRFQPTETPSFWDQLSGVVQQGASGYTLGRALKQEQEDRAERKRQQERREGREDWEWGIVPEGEEAAPRETATYPNTPVPPDTLPALGGGRSGSTVGDFLEVDEGFQPRRPMGPELEDEGFLPQPSRGPREVDTGFEPGPSIADFLGDEPLQDIQPRRYPGMDPYRVGGRTYDPEVPLRRGLTTRRAELTLADELAERAEVRAEGRAEGAEVRGSGRKQAEVDRVRQQKITAMIEAGVDPKRAAGIVDAGAQERELFPDQFRTSWPVGVGERKPIPSLDAAINAVYKLYGTYDPNTQSFMLPDQATPEWIHGAARALQGGGEIPDLPPAPELPPEEPQGPGFFTRLGRGLIPGGRSFSDEAPRGTPRPRRQVEGPRAGEGGEMGRQTEAQRAWDENARKFGREAWEAVAGPRP
jgi:hypothetical protein